MPRKKREPTHVVRVWSSDIRDLHLLRIGWELPTIAAVIHRLLDASRHEKIRALGITQEAPDVPS